MKKLTATLLIIASLLFSKNVLAEEIEYRPGGDKYISVWNKFYNGDHEPELDDPLIGAGKAMTLVICEAIRHPNMRLRRYAILALGFIADERALPALESILKSRNEIYYFRGDALHSIYQIDKALGKKYAAQFGDEHEYLKMLQKAIETDASWLTEPSEEK